MVLLATLVGISAVAYWLINIGGKLRDAENSGETLDDIRKIYKLESKQDRLTQDKLDGNNVDDDSIASVFPDELHGLSKNGADENLRSPKSSKD